MAGDVSPVAMFFFLVSTRSTWLRLAGSTCPPRLSLAKGLWKVNQRGLQERGLVSLGIRLEFQRLTFETNQRLTFQTNQSAHQRSPCSGPISSSQDILSWITRTFNIYLFDRCHIPNRIIRHVPHKIDNRKSRSVKPRFKKISEVRVGWNCFCFFCRFVEDFKEVPRDNDWVGIHGQVGSDAFQQNFVAKHGPKHGHHASAPLVSHPSRLIHIYCVTFRPDPFSRWHQRTFNLFDKISISSQCVVSHSKVELLPHKGLLPQSFHPCPPKESRQSLVQPKVIPPDRRRI